ncbi:MAG: hypothetical protein K6G55_08005 [Selenomonadaceae bacterium]|nr:hypothetical protein [Selenomonadaceae bacterium]
MKKFFGLLLMMMMISSTTFAMRFYWPVKIGLIGFAMQSPYHGFVIEGATKNDGEPYYEKDRNPQLTTYKKGNARFDYGDDALYCNYDFETKNDSSEAIKFGGKDNYILSRGTLDKEIIKIDSDEGITFYVIYHENGGAHFHIMGNRGGDNWRVYVDSKKISENLFEGKDEYKLPGGVVYMKPKSKDDMIIFPYCRYSDYDNMEGEIRLKWDASTQNFDVKKVIYTK